MKRPWLVRIAVAAQTLMAVACIVVVGLVLKETRNPKIIAEGKETLHGLYLGAEIVSGAALVDVIAAVGLWKRWRWTWWLGVAFNGFLGGATLLDPIKERSFDWDEIWLGACFVVIVVLLVLPAVRKLYFGDTRRLR